MFFRDSFGSCHVSAVYVRFGSTTAWRVGTGGRCGYVRSRGHRQGVYYDGNPPHQGTCVWATVAIEAKQCSDAGSLFTAKKKNPLLPEIMLLNASRSALDCLRVCLRVKHRA